MDLTTSITRCGNIIETVETNNYYSSKTYYSLEENYSSGNYYKKYYYNNIFNDKLINNSLLFVDYSLPKNNSVIVFYYENGKVKQITFFNNNIVTRSIIDGPAKLYFDVNGNCTQIFYIINNKYVKSETINLSKYNNIYIIEDENDGSYHALNTDMPDISNLII